MAEPLDLLAIMAHPDDAELCCGGTLIKAARAGRRVGVLDLTAGEMGSAGTPETRAREAARAAEIMGLVARRCAGLPDSALENDNESRHVVAEHVRSLRPRVVIAQWKVGRHRDHRIASELVRDGCFLAGLRKLDVAGEPFRPRKLVYATSFRADAHPPDFVVDVSEHVDRKEEAIAAYTSQFRGVKGLGEVRAGGDRMLVDQVRAQMAHYGALIRVAYGEPFRVDEPFAVEDITALDVPTY